MQTEIFKLETELGRKQVYSHVDHNQLDSRLATTTNIEPTGVPEMFKLETELGRKQVYSHVDHNQLDSRLSTATNIEPTGVPQIHKIGVYILKW